MVMKGNDDFGKEETLLFLISLLIQNYGQPSPNCIPECSLNLTHKFMWISYCFYAILKKKR